MFAGHPCVVVLHLLVYMKCLFWGHFAFPCSHFCIYSDSFSISLDNSAVGCTSLVVFVSLGGSLASGFGVLHLLKVDFVSLCGSFSGVLVDRFLWFTLGCEPEKTSSAVLVQEKEKGWKKKIVLEWFLTWPCLCCVADDEMTWKMSAGQRKTEIWRSEEKKTEGEQDKDRRQRGRSRDNKEDVIPASLLQHPFSLHSLIVSFLLFALPLIFFFLLFILSLFVSVISFYLSVSLAFCCSDTQTNEPWNIRHQDTGRVFWVCICVW